MYARANATFEAQWLACYRMEKQQVPSAKEELREAMRQYKLSEGFIITMNEKGIQKTSEGTINIVSSWKYFSKLSLNY